MVMSVVLSGVCREFQIFVFFFRKSSFLRAGFGPNILYVIKYLKSSHKIM
jgi:hypothetical protein